MRPRRDWRILAPKLFRPDEFSIMPRSMIVMIGATRVPAAIAAAASEPIRGRRFEVLNLGDDSVGDGGIGRADMVFVCSLEDGFVCPFFYVCVVGGVGVYEFEIEWVSFDLVGAIGIKGGIATQLSPFSG